MELPTGYSCGQIGYTYEADASTAHEPEAMVKNAGQVALEMGNSAAVVMKHYFDIVEARAAREYWNIRPLARADRKIVALR